MSNAGAVRSLVGAAAVGLVLTACDRAPADPLAVEDAINLSATNRTNTAQSVMIVLYGASDFVIEEEQTWSYAFSGQPGAVAAFDTYFTVTTSGGPNASQIATAKHNAFKAPNRCNLWNGNALQTVTSTFGGRSVTATPKSPSTHAAKTGWNVEVTGGGPVEVSLDYGSYIASQNAVDKATSNGNQPWKRKYSFGLDEARIVGLTVELLDAANYVVAPYSGEAGVSGYYAGEDFEYNGNAGSSGPNGILANGLVSGILNGTVGGNDGKKDDFAGNDGEGAVKAHLNSMTWSLGEGEYTLSVRGTVRGVAGAMDALFNGTKQVTIFGGC